jgi:peptidoglycan/LPS O-acetylase OafA/YrhL
MAVASGVALQLGLPAKMGVSLPEYVSALTFVINYYQALTGSNSVLGHLWSLSVEEHTYLALLLIAFAVRWSARAGVIMMTIVSVAAVMNGLMLHSSGLEAHAVYWRTDVRIASVLLSCVLFLLLSDKRVPGFVAPVLLALGIGVFALAPDPVRYTVGSLLFAVSVNSLASAPKGFRAVLSSRVLTAVGLYSYSLYLWQQPFYKVAERAPLWVTPIALAATVVAAVASYHLVEQPAREAINARYARLGKRPRH